MSARHTPARQRVGRVSFYSHHGAWWVYHRAAGKPVRVRVTGGAANAECIASLLNARLVADAAGIDLASMPLPGVTLASLPVANLAVAQADPAGPTTPPIGVDPGTAAVTVSRLRSAFLAHHENVMGSALTTVARYRSATQYLHDFAESQSLTNALPVPVTAFIEHLRQVQIAPNGHRNTAKRRLRDKGVQYILETCRSMYHFGRRKNLLPRHLDNPFSEGGVGSLRIRDAKPIFVFDPDQELAFFQHTRRWALLVHFTLAKTGLRPSELTHLLIEDVDLVRGWLSVRGKPELGWFTKTNRERRVPLIAEVMAVLKTAIGCRSSGPVFLRESFDLDDSGAVMGGRAELATLARQLLEQAQNRKGAALSRTEEARILRGIWWDAGAAEADHVRIAFLRAARAAGLPATCPKSWRHTFATLLQEGEVDPLVRQETLGHKPLAPELSALGMTGVYTHTRPQVLKAQIERALRLRPQTLALVSNSLEASRD